VFLGANGTGKSKLLQELIRSAGTLYPDHAVIRIEGGRAIKIQDSLALTSGTYNKYRTLEIATQTYKKKLAMTLSSRVHDALLVLERMGHELKTTHSDAVALWQRNPSQNICPQRSQPPLERVFDLFNEVFPRIRLKYHESSQRMSCTKGGSTYSPSLLSDGEKQCFSVLADLVELADSVSVVLVDEPELNLNPLLANRLWDIVESEFPQATFIYATHSVSFAMRDSVMRVHVLSDNDASIQEIDVIGDVAMDELPPLLGSIPAILTTSSAVVTEGTDKSFDGIFYRWLAPTLDFETVPVGGGADVAAVAARRGVWEAISMNFKLVGVIDRDFKSDQEVADLAADCTVLERHEAESYLCCPKILVQLADAIGTVGKMPTEAVILGVIESYFSEQSVQICARRVFSRLTHRIGVSGRRRIFTQLSDFDSLDQLIKKEVKSELEKTHDVFDEVAVAAVFTEERERCEKALEAKDNNLFLTLAPGKQLLNILAPKIGCKNSLAVARAAKKHLDVNSIPELVKLRDTIRRALK